MRANLFEQSVRIRKEIKIYEENGLKKKIK